MKQVYADDTAAKVAATAARPSLAQALSPPKPERWYRLTTSTGPAAIETCETLDGKVVSRKVVEEKNVRAVVLARLGDMLDGVEDS